MSEAPRQGASPEQGETTAEPVTMSAIDRLIAESEIRQQIVLYSFLADGDGETKPDIQALADQILMPDVDAEVYRDNGTLMRKWKGNEEMIRETPPAPPTINRRHLMVQTYFDEVAPTTAKTRSVGIDLRVTKNLIGADAKKYGEDAGGGRVTHVGMMVYHDNWVKTPAGWRKSAYKIYGENGSR